MEINFLREIFTAIVGTAGACVAKAYGGWDSALTTLILFMGIDCLTGLMVAGVAKNSPHTEHGRISSDAGWRGLLKKGVTLLVVLVACRLDVMLNMDFVRDAVVIAYIANELISIIENAGLMGVPIPAVIRRAIEVLHQKSGEEDESEKLEEGDDEGNG